MKIVIKKRQQQEVPAPKAKAKAKVKAPAVKAKSRAKAAPAPKAAPSRLDCRKIAANTLIRFRVDIKADGNGKPLVHILYPRKAPMLDNVPVQLLSSLFTKALGILSGKGDADGKQPKAAPAPNRFPEPSPKAKAKAKPDLSQKIRSKK